MIVGHYLSSDVSDCGPLVQFYECPENWKPGDGLDLCKEMFPAVYCGTDFAVRTGMWEIVGAIPPPETVIRRFLDGGVKMPGGGRAPWRLVENGERTTVFGATAPVWAQKLEMYLCWSAGALGDRFDSGENPWSYENWMSQP